MEVKDRLNEILDYSKLSVLKFSKQCGLHQATLDKQLKGMRGVSVDTLIGIGNAFPEISMDWLLLGKGAMLRAKNTDDIDRLLSTIDTLNDALAAQGETIKMLKQRIKELETK